MKSRMILLTLIISLTGCEGCEEVPKPVSELEKLPLATQQGKNTFGCLLNGKAWITKSSTDAAAFYQEGVLAIGAKVTEQGREQSIGLDLYVNNIETKQYPLTETSNAGAQFAEYGRNTNTCVYEKSDLLNGTLTITRYDPNDLIISGLFEFETVNDECDTIRITNGRFDLTYAP